MGMTQSDWEWSHRLDEYWRDTPCPDEDQYHGQWHSMEKFVPNGKDEYIIVHYPGWCPEVSCWEDEAAEDRWPITVSKQGWWMAIPELPSKKTGFDKYLDKQLEDSEFKKGYEEVRAEIDRGSP